MVLVLGCILKFWFKWKVLQEGNMTRLSGMGYDILLAV